MIRARRINNFKNPVPVANLLNKLSFAGFIISEDGSSFYKKYKNNKNKFDINIICSSNVIEDIVINASFENFKDISKLPLIEKIIEKEMFAILPKMTKISYTWGGAPAGSAGLTNLNMDESLGGPRWWPYSEMEPDIKELEGWIQNQFRYKPEYIGIGDSLKVKDTTFYNIGRIPYNVLAARFLPDREQLKVEAITPDGIKKINVPDIKKRQNEESMDGDISKEFKKYQLVILKLSDNESFIMARKIDNRGDIRGIWEINGPAAVPGFAHIDEDWRNSYSLHPELLDMHDWAVEGRHTPGRHNY